MKYAIALVIALLLNATANLMIKFGMERFKAAGVAASDGTAAVATALLTNWVLVLGLCCFALNVGFYAYALKGLPISLAYPIMVTVGFAIIVTVAGIYLHERLTTMQWFGVCLILIGVWLVAWHSKSQLGSGGPTTSTPAVARPVPGHSA
jgi:multidrug transporter EmrE-like cation transporter